MSGDFTERISFDVSGEGALARSAGDAERAAGAVRKLRDELAGSGGAAGGLEADAAEMGHVRDEAAEAAAGVSALKDELRGVGAAGAEGSLGASAGLSAYRDKLAEIVGLQGALDAEQFFSDVAMGAQDAEQGLADVEGGIQDVETGLNDAEEAAGTAETAFQSLGQSLSSIASAVADPLQGASSMLSQIPGMVTQIGSLVAMYGSLAALAGGAVAVGTPLAAGAASFAALAVPSILRVKNAYEQYNAAADKAKNATVGQYRAALQQQITLDKQAESNAKAAHNTQAYEQAAHRLAAAQRDYSDATKGAAQNFFLEKAIRDLDKMGPGVAKDVGAIEQLKSSLKGLAKGTGIQKDVTQDIPGIAKDIEGLEPGVRKLGTAFGPVVSKVIGDVGKLEKSKGFSQFVTDLSKDIPQAVPAVEKLSGALGGILTSLTKPGVVKNFSGMFQNIAAGLKEITPSAVKGLEIFGTTLGDIVKDFADLATGNEAGTDKSSQMPAFLTRFGPLGKPETIHPKVKIGKPQVEGGRDITLQTLLGGKDGKAKASPAVTLHPNVQPGDTKAKVQKSVSDAARDVKIHGLTVSLAGAKLSGQQALQSTMQKAGQAAGKALDTGVGNGISSGASAAASAAKTIESDAKAALAGLPGEFRQIGVSAADGLAAGIRAGTGAAVAAASALASAVEAAAKVTLQSHSPSRKFQKIGQDTAAGLILGLEGGEPAVKAAMRAMLGDPYKNAAIASTVKKLQADINSAFAHGKITGQQRFILTQQLADDNTRLQHLAQQRAKILSEIKAAEALAKSVTSGAESFASITGIAGNTQAGLQASDQAQGALGSSQNPYQNIQQGQEAKLAQIRQFEGDIRKLKREGLDERGIKQLLQEGVSGGLPAAEQILSEGQGGVKSIASLDRQIAAASKKLGVTGANASYESAKNIGGALAQGLKDSLKPIEAAMDAIARTMVTTLMKAEGASASAIRDALKKLDRELGLGGGDGGGAGGSGGHKVHPPHLIRHQPIVPHHPVGHGGGHVMQPVHITVVSQLKGREVARSTRTVTLRDARDNISSGYQLAGRAV